MFDLSIIVLNWNTAEHLRMCLASIFSNPPTVSHEIIVVDNNSEEGIGAIGDQFPSVRIILNDRNYGFAVGNNIGFRESAGRYVMTLNPDTLVHPDMIDRLVWVLESDKDISIAVPHIRGIEPRRTDHSFVNLFFNSIVWRALRKPFRRSAKTETEPFEVEFIGGTGYICRRSALSKDKIFREDFFLFGEEYELCKRIKAQGQKIVVVPDAQIDHAAGVTFKYDPERLMMASRLGAAIGWRIRKEHWGWLIGTASGLVLWSEHLFKFGLLSAANLFRPSDKRRGQLLQSKAVIGSLLPLLFNETEYIARVDREAAKFFNGGE